MKKTENISSHHGCYRCIVAGPTISLVVLHGQNHASLEKLILKAVHSRSPFNNEIGINAYSSAQEHDIWSSAGKLFNLTDTIRNWRLPGVCGYFHQTQKMSANFEHFYFFPKCFFGVKTSDQSNEDIFNIVYVYHPIAVCIAYLHLDLYV